MSLTVESRGLEKLEISKRLGETPTQFSFTYDGESQISKLRTGKRISTVLSGLYGSKGSIRFVGRIKRSKLTVGTGKTQIDVVGKNNGQYIDGQPIVFPCLNVSTSQYRIRTFKEIIQRILKGTGVTLSSDFDRFSDIVFTNDYNDPNWFCGHFKSKKDALDCLMKRVQVGSVLPKTYNPPYYNHKNIEYYQYNDPYTSNPSHWKYGHEIGKMVITESFEVKRVILVGTGCESPASVTVNGVTKSWSQFHDEGGEAGVDYVDEKLVFDITPSKTITIETSAHPKVQPPNHGADLAYIQLFSEIESGETTGKYRWYVDIEEKLRLIDITNPDNYTITIDVNNNDVFDVSIEDVAETVKNDITYFGGEKNEIRVRVFDEASISKHGRLVADPANDTSLKSADEVNKKAMEKLNELSKEVLVGSANVRGFPQIEPGMYVKFVGIPEYSGVRFIITEFKHHGGPADYTTSFSFSTDENVLVNPNLADVIRAIVEGLQKYQEAFVGVVEAVNEETGTVSVSPTGQQYSDVLYTQASTSAQGQYIQARYLAGSGGEVGSGGSGGEGEGGGEGG